MAVSAMCEEGKTEARAHVSAVFDKLYGLLESSQDKDTAYQVLLNSFQLKTQTKCFLCRYNIYIYILIEQSCQFQTLRNEHMY